MRSTMVCLFLFSFAFAILTIAVDGGYASSGSPNKVGIQTDDRRVICNIVEDSHSNEAIKSLEKTLEKKFELLIAAVNKTTQGHSFYSCKDIYDNHKSQGNQAYLLQLDSQRKVPVYCHMTSSGLGACGGGGWTLVMKIDGAKPIFHYHSKLWSNKIDFNLPGGKVGFNQDETKLPTYWSTHFSRICLGMRIGHQMNFIVINKNASSLYSLIADGKYRVTTLGRNTWKSLLGRQGSLQRNCNREDFNVRQDARHARARIGILGNNENDCSTCDSRIGFGTGGAHDNSNTCGNEAISGGDNGNRHVKTMGYILVQ